MKKFNLDSLKVKAILEKLKIIDSKYYINSVVDEILSNKKCVSVSFLNYHALNLSLKYSNVELSLLESDYLFRDGVGIEKLMRWSSIPPGLNMNGTDLIPTILKRSNIVKRKVVLIGSEKSNVCACSYQLKEKGVDVVLTLDGFLDESYYIDALSKLKGDSLIIVLGMGMPKQELFSAKVKQVFSQEDFVVISGGAIINRIAGKVKRGPGFLVNNNLEWLYRFYSEPKRLFSRIIFGGGKFLLFAVMFSIQNRIFGK